MVADATRGLAMRARSQRKADLPAASLPQACVLAARLRAARSRFYTKDQLTFRALPFQ
jgi:hypothetical protein